MLSHDETKSILERVLSRSSTGQVELVFRAEQQQLTRYGANALVQNVARTVRSASLRLQDDGKQASTTLHQFDEASIDKAFAQARAILKVTPIDKDLLPILSEAQDYKTVDAFSHEAVNHCPKVRAHSVGKLLDRCETEGYTCAGRYEVATAVEAYANSHGLFAYHPSSNAVYSATVTGPKASSEGWATGAHHDPAKLDCDAAQAEAFEIARTSQKPQPLKAGRYSVVLKPAAVSELMFFLSRLGFNGRSFLEKRSYLKGVLGGKYFGDNVLLKDDPFDSRMPGRPWDYEGSSTAVVPLIEKGHSVGLCWDRDSAQMAENQQSTGHSLQQPNNIGPQARNIIMEGEPGKSVEDLIHGLDDGLLINRFHYCNVVNPMELSITGMSRSGVFEVKNGEIARPLCNFRFTVSLFEILSKIDAMSEAVRAEGALFGARFVAPALRLHDFQITSTTEF
jgi:PmbA protein